MAQALRGWTSTPSTLSPETASRRSAVTSPSPQPISRSRDPGASISASFSANTAILRSNTTFPWIFPSSRMPALALMSVFVIADERPPADAHHAEKERREDHLNAQKQPHRPKQNFTNLI